MCDTARMRGLAGGAPGCRAADDRTTSAIVLTAYTHHAPRLHGFFFTFEPPRRRDAERLHLSIEVAPLDAEDLRRPRHVALLLGERSQDEIALEAVARFVQRQPPGGRGAALGTRRRVGI